MTPYATLDDIVARAGQDEVLQVADRDGDGTADPAVVSAAIVTAGHTIDAYLAARYTLPLSAVPDIVRGWAVALARYSLHLNGAPEYVVRDWKQALGELAQAGAGKLVVTGAAGVAPDRSSDGEAMAEGSELVFTRENLGGWL